jgi:hypothetical protein
VDFTEDNNEAQEKYLNAIQDVPLKTGFINSGHWIARRVACSAILFEEEVLALMIGQVGIESNFFCKSVHLVYWKINGAKSFLDFAVQGGMF